MQLSYSSVLGKFSDGNEILKGITVYNPTKQELKLASLENMKTEAEQKNAAVTSAGNSLQTLRGERRFNAFRVKGSDTNCLENRIHNISSYIKAEMGAAHPAVSKIDSIIKKFRPPSEKKVELKEGEEPKKSRSQSEKTYQSLVGYAGDVYTIITGLGEKYNPSNQNITVVNFKAKVDELAALNSAVAKAENAYSSAVQERNEIYNGEVGIKSIISSIKDYLASLEGGKNNAAYVAYTNAVK